VCVRACDLVYHVVQRNRRVRHAVQRDTESKEMQQCIQVGVGGDYDFYSGKSHIAHHIY